MFGLNLVADESEVPFSQVDEERVGSQCRELERGASRLRDHADTLERRWGSLRTTYVTSHTIIAVAKMNAAIHGARRGAWVYTNLSWAIGAYCDDLRASDAYAERLRKEIRAIHRRPNYRILAITPGTEEYSKNLAFLRAISDIRSRHRAAADRCKARLDAIGEPGHENDPYEGITNVTKQGSPFGDLVPVFEGELDWPLWGESGKISGSQVQQGNLGDCWFMSALAALADKDPGAIERMVHDNGDGTYTVTLYAGGEWRAVQVDATMLMDETGPRFAGGGDAAYNDTALWPLLVEKAAIKVYGGEYFAMNAGTGAMAMELFTGQPASDDGLTRPLPGGPGGVADYSALSKDPHVIMTANSNVDLTTDDSDHLKIQAQDTNKEPLEVEFAKNHVYQIVGIDPDGNVTLSNPWNKHATYSGGIDHDQFVLTAEQFEELFINVSIGRTAP